MSTERKLTEVVIEQIDLTKMQVRLGIDFMATLDKKTYFPKHISLLTQVEDSNVFQQLVIIKPGTKILARINSDSINHVSFLERIELLN